MSSPLDRQTSRGPNDRGNHRRSGGGRGGMNGGTRTKLNPNHIAPGLNRQQNGAGMPPPNVNAAPFVAGGMPSVFGSGNGSVTAAPPNMPTPSFQAPPRTQSAPPTENFDQPPAIFVPAKAAQSYVWPTNATPMPNSAQYMYVPPGQQFYPNYGAPAPYAAATAAASQQQDPMNNIMMQQQNYYMMQRQQQLQQQRLQQQMHAPASNGVVSPHAASSPVSIPINASPQRVSPSMSPSAVPRMLGSPTLRPLAPARLPPLGAPVSQPRPMSIGANSFVPKQKPASRALKIIDPTTKEEIKLSDSGGADSQSAATAASPAASTNDATRHTSTVPAGAAPLPAQPSLSPPTVDAASKPTLLPEFATPSDDAAGSAPAGAVATKVLGAGQTRDVIASGSAAPIIASSKLLGAPVGRRTATVVKTPAAESKPTTAATTTTTAAVASKPDTSAEPTAQTASDTQAATKSEAANETRAKSPAAASNSGDNEDVEEWELAADEESSDSENAPNDAQEEKAVRPTYPKDTWAPGIGGPKKYPIEFLLQFQPLVLEPPSDANLEKYDRVYLAHDDPRRANLARGDDRRSSRRGQSDRGGLLGHGPPGSNNSRRHNNNGNNSHDNWQRGGNFRPNYDNGNHNNDGNNNGRNRSRSGRGRRSRPVLRPGDGAWQRPRMRDLAKEELILRNANGILNKLTLEKFDALSDGLLAVGIDNLQLLKGVVDLIFEKAVMEPHFSEMYARLCVKLAQHCPEFNTDEPEKHGGRDVVEFRYILLTKCQADFCKNRPHIKDQEEGQDAGAANAEPSTNEPSTNEPSVNAPSTEPPSANAPPADTPPANETPQEKALREHKDFLRRKKMLGLMRFVGELCNNGMLADRICHTILQTLLVNIVTPHPDDMESLCMLLSTAGAHLDQHRAKQWITEYLKRVVVLSKHKLLPARIRFALLDVIELRGNNWTARLKQEGPTTIDQVHEDAERKDQEAARFSRQALSGGNNNNNSRRGHSQRGRHSGDVRLLQRPGNGRANSRRNNNNNSNNNNNNNNNNSSNKSRSRRDNSNSSTHNNNNNNSNNNNNNNNNNRRNGNNGRRGKSPQPQKQQARKGAAPDSAAPRPALTLQQLQNRAENLLAEYKDSDDLAEALLCAQELGCVDTTLNGGARASAAGADDPATVLCRLAIDTVLDSNQERVWNRVSTLLSELRARNYITPKQFADVAFDSAELLADITIDVPKAPQALAEILARGLIGCKSKHVPSGNSGDPFVDNVATQFVTVHDVKRLLAPSVNLDEQNGNKQTHTPECAPFGLAACVLMRVLSRVNKLANNNASAVRQLLQRASLDVVHFLNKPQTAERAAELANAANCTDLLPPSALSGSAKGSAAAAQQ